jgi:hypothetical protein
MTTKPSTHHKVACSRCGKDAEVCPQRRTDIDVWFRAVRAFERAGSAVAVSHDLAGVAHRLLRRPLPEMSQKHSG